MNYDDMSEIDYTPNVWRVNLIAFLIAPFFFAYFYVVSAIQNYRERRELPVWVWVLGLSVLALFQLGLVTLLMVLTRWMS